MNLDKNDISVIEPVIGCKSISLAKFFNPDHNFDKGNFYLYDKNGNIIYCELWEPGHWQKFEYDSNRNETSKICSDGFWSKTEYDSDGNEIGYKCSDDKYSDGNEIKGV